MKEELFEELLTSVKQARDISKKKLKPSRVTKVEIRDIASPRAKVNVSQEEFANLLQISPATLRNWEQGRTTPEGPAQVLLQIAEEVPEAFLNLKRKKKVLYTFQQSQVNKEVQRGKMVSGLPDSMSDLPETLKAARAPKGHSKFSKYASSKSRGRKKMLKKKMAAKKRK